MSLVEFSKPFIRTERLLLRAWQPKDIPQIARLHQNPHMTQFLPPLAPCQAEGFVERLQQHIDNHGWGVWALEYLATDPASPSQLIGFLGLNSLDARLPFSGSAEILWRLDPAFWSQGLATEGAQAVLKHARQQCQLTDVVSFTVKDNWASRRVMTKIGLHHQQDADFDHPALSKDSPLCRHVLYR